MSVAAQQNLVVPPPGLAVVAYERVAAFAVLQALPAQPAGTFGGALTELLRRR